MLKNGRDMTSHWTVQKILLKRDYIVKVIEISSLTVRRLILENLSRIMEQLFWVSEDGILLRVLMDGRKQMDLQMGD